MKLGALPRSCDCCEVRLATPLRHLETVDLDRIGRSRIAHRYERGHILHYEGTPCTGVLCIYSGLAKVYRSAPGDRTYILHLAGPGTLLGLESCIVGKLHATTAEMVEPGVVCHHERAVFELLVRERPEIARLLLEALVENLRTSQAERAELAVGDAREKVARVLVRLARRYGIAAAEGVRLGVPLTRQEIAEMAGTATETTIRQLTLFRDQGLLESVGRELVLLKPEHLARIAHLPAAGSAPEPDRDHVRL
jgi:CRP-like cAMP-binding protein